MQFRDEFWFLSNLYNAPVTYQNITYPNAEAAFQAQKQVLVDANLRLDHFQNMNGVDAKRQGKRIKMSPEQIWQWDRMKDKVMYEVVKAKFSQNQYLKGRLLQTNDMPLVEENGWHDRYWGVCNGIGENQLGKILMRVRDELK